MDCIVRIWKDTGDPIIFILDAEVNYGMIMSWMIVGQHGEASIEIMHRPHTRPATESETRAAIAVYQSCYDCELNVKKRVKHERLVKNWV